MKRTFLIAGILLLYQFSFGQTYLHSAMAKIKQKDFKGALTDCNKAVETNPYLGESYQVRGSVKVMLGDYTGAIADCNKAIKLKAGDRFIAAAYTWRGLAKYQLGDRTSGCKDLREGGNLGDEQAYLFIGSYCE